jgi:ubiquinone/menaquinone biosynthesis C-methylase UbiE
LFWVEELGFLKLLGIDLKAQPNLNSYTNYCKEEIDSYSDLEKITIYRKIKERFETKFEFIVGDFFNISIEKDYFSCALSSHLLHLLKFENQLAFLNQIHYALKTNGIFILKCNNVKIKEELDKNLYEEFFENVIKGKHDDKTMYLLDHEDLKKLLIDASFEILELFELRGESLVICRKN